jgi:hypothetical protein
MVSYDPCHVYAPSYFVILTVVYQQSSQVESFFSTADYAWMLVMTGAVIMVPSLVINVLFSLCCFIMGSSFCLATVFASISRGFW